MISRYGDLLMACALAPKNDSLHAPPKSVFWMFWLGFLALFGLMLCAASQAKKKRRDALEQFGMEMGFVFSEKPDDALAARLAEIHINVAQMESTVRYRNVLQGSAGGGEAIIADRCTGSGQEQFHDHRLRLQFQNAAAAVPALPGEPALAPGGKIRLLRH